MKNILRFALILIFLPLGVLLYANKLGEEKASGYGKLKNGLTYYIKENDFHEKKASLRLLVRVGSALETDEERGIAHFLEHMVFRGSENFEDYEIVKYLESIGAEFGADTNAFTSFDRTCYMLEVPLKNEEDLEQAFVCLSDFAFKARLEDGKIQKERDIVLDELRRVSGPQMRVADKHLSVILKGTAYEDRLPIGKEEVIKYCDPQIIRNFYKKWYTPKNMAVIAVGDFDKKKVKEYISKYFSITPENETKPNYYVNENNQATYSIVHDPEISIATIELITREITKIIRTEKDIKEDLVANILYDILNERFQALTMQAESPFISAYAFENTFLSNFCLKELAVMCWEDKYSQGLESALLEVKKIKSLGISQDEFSRAIESRKKALKKEKKNLDKVDNNEFISVFHEHFIYQGELFSKKSSLEYRTDLLNTLTIYEINHELEDFFANNNWTICITLPVGVNVDQIEISKTIDITQEKNIHALELPSINLEELIYSHRDFDGKVKSIYKDKKMGYTEVIFENGVKVYLKPTNLQKDEIIIRSYAVGGKANVQKGIYDSANIALEFFYNSGIAGIDSSNLFKILDLKNSTLNIDLSFNKREISATTNKESFPDIIKLINRVFTTKNFQDQMWKKTLKIEMEKQKYFDLNPDSIFYNAADRIFTCDHYLFGQSDLNQVTLNSAKNVIDTFFSNPKDFTFFIVGDFNEEEVISILQDHLAVISNDMKPKIELQSLPNIGFPEHNETVIVRAGTEDKSQCIIGLDLQQVDFSNPKNRYILSVMRPIIKDRLLQKLRLDNGKTYGVNNFLSYDLSPSIDHCNYYISFTGPQDDIDLIKELSLTTLKELIQAGPTQQELDIAKKIVKNDFKENLQYNNYVARLLIFSHMFSNAILRYDEALLDSITLEEMNNLMSHLFSKDRYTSVIWLPKED